MTVIQNVIYSKLLCTTFLLFKSRLYRRNILYRGFEWKHGSTYHIEFLFFSLQQLRSNLREMEKLCGRVRSAEVEDLEKLVQPIRDRASTAIQEFLQIHSDAIDRPCLHETIGTASDKLHSMCFSVCLSFMKLIKMWFYFCKHFHFHVMGQVMVIQVSPVPLSLKHSCSCLKSLQNRTPLSPGTL